MFTDVATGWSPSGAIDMGGTRYSTEGYNAIEQDESVLVMGSWCGVDTPCVFTSEDVGGVTNTFLSLPTQHYDVGSYVFHFKLGYVLQANPQTIGGQGKIWMTTGESVNHRYIGYWRLLSDCWAMGKSVFLEGSAHGQGNTINSYTSPIPGMSSAGILAFGSVIDNPYYGGAVGIDNVFFRSTPDHWYAPDHWVYKAGNESGKAFPRMMMIKYFSTPQEELFGRVRFTPTYPWIASILTLGERYPIDAYFEDRSRTERTFRDFSYGD